MGFSVPRSLQIAPTRFSRTAGGRELDRCRGLLIVTAILRNQKTILSESTLLSGEYGVESACLSVPAVVTQAGVEGIVEYELSAERRESIPRCASILRGTLTKLYSM